MLCSWPKKVEADVLNKTKNNYSLSNFGLILLKVSCFLNNSVSMEKKCTFNFFLSMCTVCATCSCNKQKKQFIQQFKLHFSLFLEGTSSSASSKSATIEMFVGSSYNDTMGDTLSEVSDRSSTYFHPADHRHHHHSQVKNLTAFYSWDSQNK